MNREILIINGTIADGTGGDLRPGSILARDGRIAALLSPDATAPAGAEVVDAEGLLVTPGFIDTHSHSELAALWPGKPAEKLLQGITTEIAGQDGLSVAPVLGPGTETILRGLTDGLTGGRPDPWDWQTVADFLESLDQAGMPTHMGYLVPHSAVRVAAMGAADRPATDAELTAMCGYLEEGLAQGGLGLSTGLIYPPCSFADRRELAALCRVAARYGRPLVVHMRSEASRIVEAVEEMVDLSRTTGVQVHISHMKVMGRTNWDKCDAYLETVAGARTEGLAFSGEIYPYPASSTVLRATLPPWTLDGGSGAMVQRLGSRAERDRIKADFTLTDLPGWENRAISFGWENVVVAGVENQALAEAVGKSIAELAEERKQDPIDVICDILQADQGRTVAVYFQGSEANIEKILRFPGVNICTDGIYGAQPHPRLYGSFARFFGQYVRERKVMGLAEAVRRATGQAAANLGLRGRGLIQPGFAADLTLFDPNTIADIATYRQPRLHPTGIAHVMVGGVWAVRDGAVAASNLGRTLPAH